MIKKKGIIMFRVITWLLLNVSIHCILSFGEESDASQISSERKTTDGQIMGPYSLGVITGRKRWPFKGEKGPDCTTCVKFNLTPYSKHIKIDQSTLWIYITQPLRNYFCKNTASVQTSLLTQNNTKKSTIQQLVNYNRKGWYVIKLKNFPKHDLLGTNQIVLLIDCINCEVDLQGLIVPPAVNTKHIPEKTLEKRTIFKALLPGRQAKPHIKTGKPSVKGYKPAKISSKPPPIDVRPKICTSNSTGCCLDELFVRTKDHISGKLEDYQILGPLQFNIGKCRGSCNNPHEIINAHSAMSRNTVITSGNRYRKEGNKKPCCVPLSYYNLHVLYVNEYGNRIITKVQNMVVRECGCQL